MEPRLVGTTQECFRHLMLEYPGLPVVKLIAEFCKCKVTKKDKIGIEAVQRWQQEVHFPEGGQLLGLRCFLAIAGYNIAELTELNASARRLAYIIGLDLLSPLSAASALRYSESAGRDSVWRIVLRAEPYSKPVGEQVDALYQKYSKDLANRIASWQQRFTAVIGEPPITTLY